MSLMGRLRDRLRGDAAELRARLPRGVEKLAGSRGVGHRRYADSAAESRLRARLHDDPNDQEAFATLAEIVRHRAEEGHEDDDRRRASDDAVWALAEELAGSPRAWYPLIELARLSVHEDREGALRRLATASERDPSGKALAAGLEMLRDAGMPDAALGLGVGHWRPAEHDIAAGGQLVAAAVEAGRRGEARRHLDALGAHPDAGAVALVREELERYIAQADQGRPAGRPDPQRLRGRR